MPREDGGVGFEVAGLGFGFAEREKPFIAVFGAEGGSSFEGAILGGCCRGIWRSGGNIF